MLADLNEVLLQHETERFCTVALMRLRRDADGWSAVLSVAGHPSPLLLRGEADPRPCGGAGPLIGVIPGAEFVESTERLLPGDVLVLYTDGVPDGRRNGEAYGDERMLASLKAHGTDATSVVEGLVADVVDFQRGVPRDDIAVLAVGVPFG
jgi:sigma-B regulation protein RsbU (phosphoserine phosphatase)